jgi:hypothetical protein
MDPLQILRRLQKQDIRRDRIERSYLRVDSSRVVLRPDAKLFELQRSIRIYALPADVNSLNRIGDLQ